LIRKGFQDETITRSDPQTTYAGIDTRDVYYHGWDVSIETTPPRDKERQYQMERTFLMNKTVRTAENMTKRQSSQTVRYGVKCEKYRNPESISKGVMQMQREAKDQDQALWDELLVKARYEMPSASD